MPVAPCDHERGAPADEGEDVKGVEADLIFRASHDRLVPVEIKGGMTWDPGFCTNLKKIRAFSEKFAPGFVIYAGELTPQIEGIRFLNFRDTEIIVR